LCCNLPSLKETSSFETLIEGLTEVVEEVVVVVDLSLEELALAFVLEETEEEVFDFFATGFEVVEAINEAGRNRQFTLELPRVDAVASTIQDDSAGHVRTRPKSRN
jgi:hypothetical protein